MNEIELAKLRKDTQERLENKVGMDEQSANFVINIMATCHTTLGGALYRINDYLDNKGF